MKTLRIWLVLLLVLLLPVRGAVAAGVLCEAEFSGAALASSHEEVHTHHHAGPLGHVGHEHSTHAHGGSQGQVASADTAAGATSASAAADSCGLCTGCCSAAAIVSNVPFVAPPNALSPVPFPSLAAAAPSFIPGGLERPPRTI